MAKVNWTSMKVPATKVQAIRDALDDALKKEPMKASWDVEYPFYYNRVKAINRRIAAWVNEGQQICYPEYDIAQFIISSQKGGPDLAYDSTVIECSCEVIARAEEYVEQVILNKHLYTLRQYQQYDIYSTELTAKYEKIIAELGGNLAYRRPYCKITLPVLDSLKFRTQRMPVNSYSLKLLDAYVKKLQAFSSGV